MRSAILLILSLPVILLAGCDSLGKDGGKPSMAIPPPISLEDQLQRLNTRAAALANFKGHGKVTVTYFDPDGKQHTHDADGTLQLRQYPDELTNPADMLLVGRVVGQDAFEAGMNRTNYWMAVRLDARRAYVGSVANMAKVPVSAMPLRADRVVELLGITPLRNSLLRQVHMLVNEAPATNDIYVTQLRPDGRSYIERVIVIDRTSGTISQIRLYHPDGTLLARAELTRYRPVPPAEGSGPAAAFPMNIVLEYPDQNTSRTARVKLEVNDLATVPEIPAKRFALPDFQAQGLSVLDFDEPGPG